jgi:hypothetical protein
MFHVCTSTSKKAGQMVLINNIKSRSADINSFGVKIYTNNSNFKSVRQKSWSRNIKNIKSRSADIKIRFSIKKYTPSLISSLYVNKTKVKW